MFMSNKEIKYIVPMNDMKDDYTKKLFVYVEGQIILQCNKNIKSINEINEDLLKKQIEEMYGMKFLNIKRIVLGGDD